MKRIRLNEDQIKYIIRQRQDCTSAAVLARTMKVSARHVRRIWAAYRKTGKVRPPGKPGSPRKTHTPEDVRRVLKTYDEMHAGAVRTAHHLREAGHIQ